MLIAVVTLLYYTSYAYRPPTGDDRGHYQYELSASFPDTIIIPDTNLSRLSPAKDTIDISRPGNALDAKVDYSCQDSIKFDFKRQKIYLYGEAEIEYDDINLKADYIEIDLDSNILYATGFPDTAGVMRGLPVFSEGGQSFKSTTMRYNYKTRKGYIKGVLTKDGYGYLHGKTVKKLENNEFNISGGSYTTCEHEGHPHFEFRYHKSRVVPGKRIVTGPAYLVIEDVPTPLAIPFGWFPVEQGKKNGIIIPSYGESANRGFYFENMGYYLSVGEHVDFTILGDIFTKGSWGIKPSMRYRKRYKYNGKLNFGYSNDVLGTKGTPDYSATRNFSVAWSHKQDRAARPNSLFSADVNIKSSSYNRFNPTSTQDYLSNTFRSSIAYQTSFGDNFNLTLNAGHEQNTYTHAVKVSLPEVNFNVNRFYPFRSSKNTAGNKWYQNITMSYNLNARNEFSNPDSVFFSQNTLETAQNGIKHVMPISSPVKILKHLNLTNSINLTDRMYFQSYNKHWVEDTLFVGNDTIVGYEMTDTINGFKNAFDFSLSASLATKIYGMFRFGSKSPINAIRHVFTPSLSFSYTPDFGSSSWGYYDSYMDGDGNEHKYSVFQGSIYGSPPPNKSGRLGLILANKLDMKVRSRKDTITGYKKVALIDNFTIAAFYDFARDSLNLSDIILSGRTRLFKQLNISYRASFDPYVLDSTGTRNLNKFEWTENRRLLRLDNTNWSVSMNYRFNSKDLKKNKGENYDQKKEFNSEIGTEAELEEINMMPDEYIDWSIPWDINISYTFNYTARHTYAAYQHETSRNIVQTLGLRGNVSLTPKWKVGFVTGWDFENNDMSFTSISIYRDLHCWEMRFNWIPTGFQKSWNFSINAKASILQDLKLTKKKARWDY